MSRIGFFVQNEQICCKNSFHFTVIVTLLFIMLYFMNVLSVLFNSHLNKIKTRLQIMKVLIV